MALGLGQMFDPGGGGNAAPFPAEAREAGHHEFVEGFAALHAQLGALMGSPLEDEHPVADAEAVQLTSTGLAVWRAGEAPSFTDGWRVWALEEPNGELAAAVEAGGAVTRPPPPAGPPNPPPGVWDRLAGCESGGNWASVSNPRYKGGLQMDATFWARYGGLAYAPAPQFATRAQQIAVAIRGQAVQGWGAWPVCSRVVGLR